MEYIRRIEKILKKRNKTTAEMLKELNLSAGLISNWKKGTEPSANKLLQICEYLNISIDYVLKGEENKENLSKNEKEMLHYFNKLDDREQLKEIARLELITEEKEERLDNTKLSS